MSLKEFDGYLGLIMLRREKKMFAYVENSYTNKNPQQKRLLDTIFKILKYPGKTTRINLSILTNLSVRRVQVYFQNLRMNLKKTVQGRRLLDDGRKGSELRVDVLFKIFEATRFHKPFNYKMLNLKECIFRE